ncbi:hypothetical protein [Stenotrophomonas rhizophila]|uniref:hypothetical protein n=1 Tax=Stenotrophomonas rhizophila TaxID=216778 RepID=UPI0033957F0D
MTKYNTGNPVGSSSPLDLYDNAENLDAGINGASPTWRDRRGLTRKSWAGVETDFQQFLIDGSVLTYGSYAEASAVAGDINRKVQVVGDSGTHVDPVTGATVSNSGTFTRVAAGLQFLQPDVLVLKLDADAANPRTIDFLHRAGFAAGQVYGPFGQDLVTPANLPFTVSSGQLAISPVGPSSFIRVFGTGQRRYQDMTVRMTMEIQMDAMGAGTYGPFTGFGNDQSAFRGIWYNNAGVLSLVDSAGAVVGGQSVNDSTLAFTAGQVARLEVEVRPDGKGWAVATHPTGAILRLNLTGIPLGAIWAVWRRAAVADTGRISLFHVQHVPVEDPKAVVASVNKAGNVFAVGFRAENVDGLYAATTGAMSTQRWGIASGKLRMNLTATGIYLANVGMVRQALGSMEYEAVATVTSGAGGALIAIGDDPASRLVFAYLTNGFVGVLNSSNGVVAGGVDGSMVFGVGQQVRVRVVTRADNTGSVTAISPSGQEVSVSVSGIPLGTVWAAQRNAGTVEVERISAVPMAGSLAGVESKMASQDLTSNDWQTYRVLPDSTPGRAVPGFTGTGISPIPSGGFKGCFANGNDGRLREGDGSPNEAEILITDPQHSRILMKIPGGYTGASLQGVACDTLAASATVWAACSENGTIRNYAIYGAQAQQEVVSDRIVMADLGLAGFNPNALAFDASRGTGRGALWVGSNSGTTVHCIDADPAAATRILATITLANNPDHFQMIDGRLFYQYGANGVRANIRLYDLAANTEAAKWGPLNDALAPEGFYYDKTSRTLFLLNDGGFHDSVGNIKLNVVFQYKVSPP